jgi:hypothetical protein
MCCNGLGRRGTKNSTSTCLPKIRLAAIAKEIAMSWEIIMISMEPGTGRRKTFAPMTSIQVTNIIRRIPVSPIHSTKKLNL